MSLRNTADPVCFANQWSFNGRFYLWLSFFHGLALLTGRDVTAHDAFHGQVYHADIFGPQGAIYKRLDGVGPADAEERLWFSEHAMRQIRANEVRYLYEAHRIWTSAGLLFGYVSMMGAIVALTYAIGTGMTLVGCYGLSAFFMPFAIGSLGKRLVRRLWSNKRAAMGSFASALPWMAISTSPSR